MKTDDSTLRWTQLEERVIFRNEYVGFRNDLAKRPDGKNVDYVVVENRSYTTVMCLDEDGRTILVKQYRYPWMQLSWEAPSGLIEDGESPEECAHREVLEETGYEVISISPLLKYHPSGLGPGICHLYKATVRKKGEQHLDSNEFIQVEAFERQEIERMIRENDIKHGSTLLGWAYMAFM
ncbi:MAG: NUDIX hydrolase [Candidatus Thorarchaeota archaeon]